MSRDAFASFLAQRGLVVDYIESDGRVHRCKTEDHPRKKNGAYLFDGFSGWAQNWATDPKAVAFRNGHEPTDEEVSVLLRRSKSRHEEVLRLRAKAVQRARDMLVKATPDVHPYLARKGFPNQRMFVLDNNLLVPMWDVRSYSKRLLCVQSIDDQGVKKYVYGARTKGACYRIGPSCVGETWLCEGYATGLSLHAALKYLHRTASVVVCFSAGNLIEVAKDMPGYVVADNDTNGVGEGAAAATGLPFCMPPQIGDFNDYHQKRGVEAAASLLRILLTTHAEERKRA